MNVLFCFQFYAKYKQTNWCDIRGHFSISIDENTKIQMVDLVMVTPTLMDLKEDKSRIAWDAGHSFQDGD